MKVYATIKSEEGKVILKEWKSIKSFETNERWCDPKFINIAKTDQLEGYEFYPSQSGNFIMYTLELIESYTLLYRQYHTLRAKGIIH